MAAATMKVKGSTLLSRRAMLGERIGLDKYDAFVADFARRHPELPQPIMASTLVPVDVFLAFNDELVRRFFEGKHDIWWEIGEKSADFFSSQGPYVDSFYRGDYHRFWSKLPMIWKTLYTEGEARASESGGTLDIELDCPVAHVYFELSTIAFVKRGLEMKAGRKVEMKRISGFERGHTVHYQFQLPPA
jgi:hypothetical protein